MWISLKNRKRGFLLVRSQNFHQTPPWSWVRLLHLLATVVLKLRDSDRKTLPFLSVMYIYERKNASDGEFTYLGRLLNQKNVTFKHQSLSWGPRKILHRRGRSCGSRLSICQTQAIKKLQILRRQCCLPDSCPKRSLGEILWSHQEKSSFATFKRNPYENSLWACKNLSDLTKLTN